MADFNWKTEDDFEWDGEESKQPSKNRWRRLLIPIVIVALLAGAGYAVYTRITNTVAEVTAETEAELESTIALMYERADAGDFELFRAMLSGRDASWSQTQQQMVVNGDPLDRSFLGLNRLEEAPDVTTVWVNPALDSAEITTTIRYQTVYSEPVTLLLPHVFRQGDPLWLYAPPLDAFWGETKTVTTTYFAASYPARDEAIVRRLMQDLDAGFDHICMRAIGPEECATIKTDKVRMPVTFTTAANALQMFLLEPYVDEPYEMLPTPSLVGLPADDASYRMLAYGYANILINNQFFEFAQSPNFRRRPYAEAIMERLWVEADLRDEMVSAETLQALYNEPPINFIHPPLWLSLPSGEPVVPSAVSDELKAATIIKFSHEYLNIDLAAGVDLLANRSKFDDWARDLMSEQIVRQLRLADGQSEHRYEAKSQQITEAFGHYLLDAGGLIVQTANNNPPLPYPETPIALSCESDSGSELVRWHVPSNTFETVYSPEDLFLNKVLPHTRSGGFVIEQQSGGRDMRSAAPEIVLLDANGVKPLVQTGEYLYSVLPNSAENVAVSTLDTNTGAYGATRLIDALPCDSDSCPSVMLEGVPVSNQTGSRFFINTGSQLKIYSENAEEQLISFSDASPAWPFWLDENTLVRFENQMEVQLFDVALGTFSTVLDRSILQAQLGLPDGAIAWIWGRSSAQSDEMLLSITTPQDSDIVSESYIYNVETQTFSDSFGETNLGSGSAGGRFLRGWQYTESGGGQLSIYDRERNQYSSVPGYYSSSQIWLDDNNWVLRSAENSLQLIAPAFDYVEYVAPPEGLNCHNATLYPE